MEPASLHGLRAARAVYLSVYGGTGVLHRLRSSRGHENRHVPLRHEKRPGHGQNQGVRPDGPHRHGRRPLLRGGGAGAGVPDPLCSGPGPRLCAPRRRGEGPPQLRGQGRLAPGLYRRDRGGVLR